MVNGKNEKQIVFVVERHAVTALVEGSGERHPTNATQTWELYATRITRAEPDVRPLSIWKCYFLFLHFQTPSFEGALFLHEHSAGAGDSLNS